ncbi:MAG: radical SAM protein [Planctomycetes bacterium]|nr:radical SAM protein [Planctomycetota bacterium]
MSTVSVDALAHVPTFLDDVRAYLIDVALGRLPKDAERLTSIRDTVEQRFADGDETEPVLETLVRCSILCGDRDRAKTTVELLTLRFPDNELGTAMLPELNRSLGLADTHNTFDDDGRTNSVLNEGELRSRATRLESTPCVLEVASTNVCNIHPPCVQCWKHFDPIHGYINNDAKHMPKELIRRLAPWIGRARAVSLHGIGEPLAHPQIFDSVKHTGPGTEVVLVSNALLLTDTRINKILDNRVASIDFSLDAATQETFRKIRGNDLNAAIRGIERLREARDERGLDRPHICLNMCLMRENVREAPAFVELAHRLGAARVHLFHMNKGANYRFEWFDYDDQHCERDPETHDAAIEAAFLRAEEFGVHLVMSGRRRFSETRTMASAHPDPNAEGETFFCSKPWTSMLVMTNGDVFNCCWQDRPIGNMNHASAWDIWNSTTLQEIRESTAAGVPHKKCVNSRGNLCPYLGRV